MARCFAALVLLALAALAPSATRAGDVDIRVRIAWGGGEAKSWQGTIRLTAGTLSEVTSLGLEADAPGSLLPMDTGVIRVHPRTPRTYDGCDLHVQAPPGAALVVQLGSGVGESGPPLEIPLSRLLKGFAQFELDDRENRLLAHRSHGDTLRVNFSRQSLIFTPGEKFELEVRPHELELAANTGYLLSASLGPARGDDQTWTEDREVRVDAAGIAAGTELAIPVPEAEGVYDVRLNLYPKQLTSSLWRGKPLASRKVQFIVLSPVKLIGGAAAAWQSVLEFDPATPKWWERVARLPSWTRLPTMPQPVGSAPAAMRTHLNRPWVELAPQAWQAYPLSVANTGAPHVLEVEFPSDLEQTLAISILEPNAAGQVGPIGIDSGVDVPLPAPGHKPQSRKHRLVFWPQTRAPYVLLVNRRDDRPAIFGKLNVLAGPTALPPLKVAPTNYAARTLAAYFDKPLVAENFAASEAVDPVSKRGLDDWLTFLEAGQRLVQSLQAGGYNAVVLTAACEGSAIYPSRVLAPTPKYDSGVFFESGQDPIRKDVLELLFRLCDRSGIQLVPAVQFAAPLPSLETIRLTGSGAVNGLEPLGPDGQTWITRHGAQGGMGVYYNALDPRVQTVMTSVIAELAERYGHHASFGGVAVQLGTGGYSLLPDETCSYDGVTIRRFLNETNVELPADEEPSLEALSKFLHTRGEAAWLAWRGEQMTKLFCDMRDEVTRRRPSARLYCTTADLLGGRAVRQAMRPALLVHEQSANIFPKLGLDLDRLAREGIVVPRPQRIVTAAVQPSPLLDRHWNQHLGISALFAADGRGSALHFHVPAPLRLPDFDAVSPFGADKTQTLLLSQIVPADSAQRERFVASLAALDAPLVIDGGWLLPQGQESSLAPLIKVFRRLPAERFETVQLANQPRELIVRKLSKNGRTYFYLLNPYPWPVTAEIDLRSSESLRLVSFADERKASLQLVTGGATWKGELQPFDLVGGELSSMQVEVAGWRLTPPADVGKNISLRVREVAQRVGSVDLRAPLNSLANPSFEQPAAEGWIPGWVHARGEGMFVGIDRSLAHGGGSSLRVTSQPATAAPAPNVWVRSDPIPAPTTGRLSLFAWIRVADSAQQPRLRLAVEGRLDGQAYYKLANVGAGEPGQGIKPLSDQWTQYHFLLTDLPLSGLTELRVGFDLMGAGNVWIDDVKLLDLQFDPSHKEQDELLKSIVTADEQLASGQLGDCWRFVESYWPEYLREHVSLQRAARPATGEPTPPTGSVPPISSKPLPVDGPAAPPRSAEEHKTWWPSWIKWR